MEHENEVGYEVDLEKYYPVERCVCTQYGSVVILGFGLCLLRDSCVRM